MVDMNEPVGGLAICGSKIDATALATRTEMIDARLSRSWNTLISICFNPTACSLDELRPGRRTALEERWLMDDWRIQ